MKSKERNIKMDEKKEELHYLASDIYDCSDDRSWDSSRDLAERLYKEGWRKPEWIPVNEMLPEKAGRYLVYGVIGSQTLMCGMYYNKYSGFDDEITHWMPLPEPPIMKDDVE